MCWGDYGEFFQNLRREKADRSDNGVEWSVPYPRFSRCAEAGQGFRLRGGAETLFGTNASDFQVFYIKKRGAPKAAPFGINPLQDQYS